MTVTAMLNGSVLPDATLVTVSIGGASDSATEGTDYDAVSDVTVTISAGQPSGMGTFSISPNDDSFVEGNETVSVGGSTSGLTGGTASLTITDDDDAGVVIAPTSLTVDEGSTGTYTLKLTSAPTASVTVGVSVPTGTDVSASPTTVTFTSGNWSTAQTVTVSAAADADAVVDDQVTITHSVSSTGDYSGKTASNVLVSITENTVPVLSIGNASAAEGAGTISFTVRLSVSSSAAVTVSWVTADGTAEAGKDYTAVTDGHMTFSAGDALSKTISVTISDDNIAEG